MSAKRSIASAALAFAAWPLGLLLVTRQGASPLADVISIAQPFSIAVLVVTAVATLLSSVLVVLPVRRPALPPAVALLPFSLPMVVALIGVFSGFELITRVLPGLPAERQVWQAAAAAPALMSLMVLALCLEAGGLMAVALATLVSPGRGPRVLTALGASVLASLCALEAVRAQVLQDGLAIPPDGVQWQERVARFIAAVGAWEQSSPTARWLFFGVVGVALFGATVLSRRGERRAGLGTAVVLLVALVLIRGGEAFTQRKLFSLEGVPVESTPLFRAQGVLGSGANPASLEDLEGLRVEILDHRSFGEFGKTVAFVARRDLTREVLERALGEAAALDCTVELVIRPLLPAFEELPSQFRPMARHLSDFNVTLTVGVLFPDDPCEGCGPPATFDGEQLQRGDRAFRLVPLRENHDLTRTTNVEFDWRDGSPGTLVAAASVALSHDLLLVVRVPRPPSGAARAP